MTPEEGSRLKPGQTILLNDRAHEWTRGLVFKVSEVGLWGVRCYAEEPEGDAWYPARWEQIAGRTGVQTTLPGGARPFEYPD